MATHSIEEIRIRGVSTEDVGLWYLGSSWRHGASCIIYIAMKFVGKPPIKTHLRMLASLDVIRMIHICIATSNQEVVGIIICIAVPSIKCIHSEFTCFEMPPMARIVGSFGTRGPSTTCILTATAGPQLAEAVRSGVRQWSITVEMPTI